MIGRHLRRCCIAVCLIGAAAFGGSAPTDSSVRPDAAQLSRAAALPVHDLLRALDQLRADNRIPAYGIAIVSRDGPVLIDARGSLPGLDADSPFRVGSITKTFTALAMLRLAEQQQIDLDLPLHLDLSLKLALRRAPMPQSLVRQLPQAPSPQARSRPEQACQVLSLFDNPWERTDPITPAMLLEHTAGFGELSPREWAYHDARPISLCEGLAVDATSRRSRWRPGTQHVYSNASPGLIAWLIEQRQAKPFESFVQEAVLAPLQMANAGFLETDRNAEQLVAGYKADGKTRIPYWHQHIHAYAALHASPRDMSKLLAVLLADGAPLLTRVQYERMLTPRTSLAARRGLRVGYGLGIYGSVRNGFLFYGHGGDADGYLARFGVLRDAGRAYFVVINTDNPPALASFRDAIERWLTADLTAPLLATETRAPQAASSAELSRYTGHYRRAASRFDQTPPRPMLRRASTKPATPPAGRLDLRVSLFAVEGHVRGLRLTGAVEATLLPTREPGQFRRSPEAIATSIFAEEHGELYLQGNLGNFIRTTASAHAP